MQRYPLLQTKLYVPPIRPGLVSRPRLIERLNQSLATRGIFSRALTVVSAPAGFGKTTLVAQWLTSTQHPSAWLSLDESDNDPTRFLTYLIAALQTVQAGVGQGIMGALRSPQPPPAGAVLTSLINDVTSLPEGVIVVLDDYHLIETQAIHDALTFLLEHLPPQMHLVIASREDPNLPLARLRARGQLTELRVRDLCFTSSETAGFLTQVMDLDLSTQDIAALKVRTEGWIAGLQLAALALRGTVSVQGHKSATSFVRSFTGSHRFILSYLTEEVLHRQPEAVQRFLLQTSILDKLNGDLCNAVTGRSDGRVVLEKLFNANLFLIPLDDEGQWYRYHHLFADLLRDLQNALQKDDTTKLHQRAAHWYAQACGEPTGEQGAFVNEAIRHALAAEDYGLAVDLLEHHAMAMIMQGYVKTVNGWVQAIPQEWAWSSPRTHLAFA